uniref:Uncharacterized protein n=1 Tax=Anguilla anguilla TaxID=7936 RepID=A0A0E9SR39_ANGAN
MVRAKTTGYCQERNGIKRLHLRPQEQETPYVLAVLNVFLFVPSRITDCKLNKLYVTKMHMHTLYCL